MKITIIKKNNRTGSEHNPGSSVLISNLHNKLWLEPNLRQQISLIFSSAKNVIQTVVSAGPTTSIRRNKYVNSSRAVELQSGRLARGKHGGEDDGTFQRWGNLLDGGQVRRNGCEVTKQPQKKQKKSTWYHYSLFLADEQLGWLGFWPSAGDWVNVHTNGSHEAIQTFVSQSPESIQISTVLWICTIINISLGVGRFFFLSLSGRAFQISDPCLKVRSGILPRSVTATSLGPHAGSPDVHMWRVRLADR